MKFQDDFEAVIDKYELWDDEVFLSAVPDEVDQELLYNQMLDECTPERSAMMFKEADPVAYQCGFADYMDSLREDYFEGPDEEFYDPDKIKDAINEALDDRIQLITEDQL